MAEAKSYERALEILRAAVSQCDPPVQEKWVHNLHYPTDESGVVFDFPHKAAYEQGCTVIGRAIFDGSVRKEAILRDDHACQIIVRRPPCLNCRGGHTEHMKDGKCLFGASFYDG